MGQLGGGQLEQDPGRDQPAEREAHAGFGPPPPAQHQGGRQQHGSRKQQQRRQQGVQPRRGPVALLARADLGQHVAQHRAGPEGAVGGHGDGPGPGADHQQDQGEPPGPAQALHPGSLAVPGPQREQGQGRHQRADRALEQDRGGHAGPEHRARAAAGDRFALAGGIDPRQRRHHQGDGPAKRCVGLGDEALGRKDQAGPQQGAGHRAAGRAEEDARSPGAGGGGDHGPQQRGDAVGPDAPRLDRGNGRDADGLQPMDAHRLLEPGDVLQVDRDDVAGLQHLGGRLGEARLVAVQDRDADQSRQGGQQGDRSRRQGAPPASGQESIDGGFGHRPLDSTAAAPDSAI